MEYCYHKNIPVKALTKQTWWIDKYRIPENVSIGFTLTGHDELEPGAATNLERIEAMETLYLEDYTTWASIEPVISIARSMHLIRSITDRCDHYKIGILSGKKYDSDELQDFIRKVNNIIQVNTRVHWKDSLLEQAEVNRKDLPIICVDRDYMWWV